MPGEPDFDIDHAIAGDWIDCWQCGGEGELADCWEEYACVDPESGCDLCLRRCDVCRGKGGWDPDLSQGDGMFSGGKE